MILIDKCCSCFNWKSNGNEIPRNRITNRSRWMIRVSRLAQRVPLYPSSSVSINLTPSRSVKISFSEEVSGAGSIESNRFMNKRTSTCTKQSISGGGDCRSKIIISWIISLLTLCVPKVISITFQCIVLLLSRTASAACVVDYGRRSMFELIPSVSSFHLASRQFHSCALNCVPHAIQVKQNGK